MADRLLYVNPNAEIGGSDASLLDLVSHLDTNQYEAVVLLPHAGPYDVALRRAGARVVYGPVAPLRRYSHPLPYLRWLAEATRAFWCTRHLIHRHRIDLVHVNSVVAVPPALAAVSCGIPLVWHIRELLSGPPLLTQPLLAVVSRVATRILAISKVVARQFPPATHSRLVVVPNGVALARFQTSADQRTIRARLELPETAPMTCFVGRLAPWKGAHVYLDACELIAAQLPQAHFLLVGSTFAKYRPYIDQLLARTRRVPLAGHITVFLNRTDVPTLMQAADVVLHSSVQPEPFGRVVIEAMAAGRPVIAAAAGGVPEIISSPSEGILVPPGDAEALAAAALAVLCDPVQAKGLAQAGRQRVAGHFTTAHLAARVGAVYRQLLTSPPASR